MADHPPSPRTGHALHRHITHPLAELLEPQPILCSYPSQIKSLNSLTHHNHLPTALRQSRHTHYLLVTSAWRKTPWTLDEKAYKYLILNTERGFGSCLKNQQKKRRISKANILWKERNERFWGEVFLKKQQEIKVVGIIIIIIVVIFFLFVWVLSIWYEKKGEKERDLSTRKGKWKGRFRVVGSLVWASALQARRELGSRDLPGETGGCPSRAATTAMPSSGLGFRRCLLGFCCTRFSLFGHLGRLLPV